MEGDVRLLTANVRYTLRPRRAARAIRDVAEDAGPRGVVLWQECHRLGHRKALRELPGDWRTYMPLVDGKPIGAPISWRSSSWKLRYASWAPLHDAVPLVCGSRQLVWVVLEHRATGELVTFHNRHYVPGAFASSWKVNAAARRRAWEEGWRRDVGFMRTIAAGGRAQAGGGDYNREGLPQLTQRTGARIQWDGHGYDHLVTVDGSASWAWSSSRPLPKPDGMDHNPFRAILELHP